jgi:hypothetical protein
MLGSGTELGDAERKFYNHESEVWLIPGDLNSFIFMNQKHNKNLTIVECSRL